MIYLVSGWMKGDIFTFRVDFMGRAKGKYELFGGH